MSHAGRGRLKVYMGYAAGVGKTYRMLDEAQELRHKGVDIVIGYFEPHGRQETIAKTAGFESVPRRVIPYAGSRFEEMDTDAILRRRPAVAIVDEFAHTNVPGSERLKRWQDVHALLEASIDVLTTMNVQHLESLNDEVWHVTGIRVRETIPDWVVDEADEVVLVDLTPRALRNRLERGVIYAQDKAQRAMENFFTETNLTALREMAMRHTAHEVEDKLHAPPALDSGGAPAARQERLLVCLTGRPASAILIRRGKRVADYLQADCLAIHVAPHESGDSGAPHELRAQPADSDAHCGSRRRAARYHRVRPRAAHHADLHGTLPAPALVAALPVLHCPAGGTAGARHADHHCGGAAAIRTASLDRV
jgi:two-component system sensor histidine kinase KdpD